MSVTPDFIAACRTFWHCQYPCRGPCARAGTADQAHQGQAAELLRVLGPTLADVSSAKGDPPELSVVDTNKGALKSKGQG